ncbi:MAG: translation initiation factor IF-3 [Pseudomonadota bacterium]
MYSRHPRPDKDQTRVNKQITSPKVRLIDEKGDNIGVVTSQKALERARAADLDLIEISPNVDPPVCKISDYGRYKYEMQKKQSEARKKQKVTDVKEVKIRPVTEEHDYQVKLRNMQRFIGHGDKVKVTMRFRGRELSHKELGVNLMKRICADLEEIAKVDAPAKLEGRQMIMVLSPK